MVEYREYRMYISGTCLHRKRLHRHDIWYKKPEW